MFFPFCFLNIRKFINDSTGPTSSSVSMTPNVRGVTERIQCAGCMSCFSGEISVFVGFPVGRTDRPRCRRPLCFCSAEGALFERVSDAVGSVGRLPDGRAGLGRDEGQGQRAHVLAGGRGPRVPAQAGRVPGQAAGPAAGRQAP